MTELASDHSFTVDAQEALFAIFKVTSKCHSFMSSRRLASAFVVFAVVVPNHLAVCGAAYGHHE